MSTQYNNFSLGNISVTQTVISQDAANDRSYVRYTSIYYPTPNIPQYNIDYTTHFDGDSVANVITVPANTSAQIILRDTYRYLYHDTYGNRSSTVGVNAFSSTLNISFTDTFANLSSVPAVTTVGQSALTPTTNQTYGSLDFTGNNPVTAAGIVYSSVHATPTLADSAISVTSSNGEYQVGLSGLTPGTLYWFRAYATNGIGTAYAGSVFSFTTPLATPVVTSSAATSIALTSATANGNVTSGDGITATGVAYGTSANPTTAGSTVAGSGAIGKIALSITGLSNGTLYHYRAYATNPSSTVYGADVTFTTLQNPTVTSSAASAVLVTSATANGNLTVAGNPVITEKGFVYSTSANPTTSDTKITVAGSSTGAYTGSMTGLTSNTTYHYRAYAISAQGTFYSADQSLTTDISYFTNPANAYANDGSFATAGSDTGVLAVYISKDGGTTWSTPKTNTYTTLAYQTYGSSTDTWGLSMTGANINSATLFCVKITSGTTNQHSQIYKGFGYAETAGSAVTGLRVQIDAKYATSTVSVDHIRVIPTLSGTNANIVAGSTAYDSTLNTLTAYNGSAWDAIATRTYADTKTTASSVMQTIYPVGAIYISTLSTNPATLLGFGTWGAYAAGRVLVGVGTSDQAFTAAATGGESTHALSIAELAAHTHNQQTSTSSGVIGAGGGIGNFAGSQTGSTGSGTAHNNLQPYVVVYMWLRSA
jgi:hypothetical protein